MDNGKFQELVLQQFQAIDKQFKAITGELHELKEGQKSLTEGQRILTEGQKSLTEGQARMENRMDRLEKSQDILATEVMAVKSKTNEVNTNLTKLAIRIESEIEPKISVLFEGHNQHTEQLTRIEEQVSKHDEYILKRIK